jgi:hypothetical protein
MKSDIRKIVVTVEETHRESGKSVSPATRKAAAVAVIANPFAGKFVGDLTPLMDIGEELGGYLTKKAVEALGIDGAKAESYGKAAIVGLDGELEHGALWHAPGGYSMREVLGGTKAIVPSTKKVGPAGARIDVPLHHINAAYVRSHFDAIEVGINDAPKGDEIIYILAMGTGPRVHDRAGGLKASEIKGEDGQR